MLSLRMQFPKIKESQLRCETTITTTTTIFIVLLLQRCGVLKGKIVKGREHSHSEIAKANRAEWLTMQKSYKILKFL